MVRIRYLPPLFIRQPTTDSLSALGQRDGGERVEGVRETSQRIRTAVEEQRHAFEEILKSIAEINSSIQVSVKESEKIADGSHEVNEIARILESSNPRILNRRGDRDFRLTVV